MGKGVWGNRKQNTQFSSLTLSLGADEAGRGVVEGLEDSRDCQANVLVTGVQADRCEAKVLKAGCLLGPYLDVRDLDREGAFASILLPPPHPHLPGPPPYPMLPPHLLLPTDMAHSGGRCRAGGGTQNRHDSFGQDLTHCEGWEGTTESGTLFPFSIPPWTFFRHPPPGPRGPIPDPAQPHHEQKEGNNRETGRNGNRGTNQTKKQRKG